MDLYPSADDKRKMGESVLSFDIGEGMRWLESAAAQDAGTLEEYRAAVEAWKSQKPRARDFVPADVRVGLAAREAEARRLAEVEFQAIWGPLFPDGVARNGTFSLVKKPRES